MIYWYYNNDFFRASKLTYNGFYEEKILHKSYTFNMSKVKISNPEVYSELSIFGKLNLKILTT